MPLQAQRRQRQKAAVVLLSSAWTVVALAHAGATLPLWLMQWGSGLYFSFLVLCWQSRPATLPPTAQAAAPRSGAFATPAALGRRSSIPSDARSPPVSPSSRNQLPFISVVVPVKDEAAVLFRPVDSLLQSTYPSHLYEIVLVDDHSADGSAEVMADLKRRDSRHIKVVRRQTYGGGKAGAMNAGFQALNPKTEIVGYVDADAFVPPETLRHVASSFATPGVVAVQVCRTVAPKLATTGLSTLQSFEFWTDCFVQELRRVGGGVCELRGNGEFVLLHTLNALGQWNEASLTDDLDMSCKIHANGGTVDFLYNVPPLLDEPVMRFSQLWRQRLRWQTGAYQRFLDHWPALVSASWPLRKQIDMLVFFGSQYYLPLMLVPDLLLSLLLGGRPVCGPLCTINGLFLLLCVGLVYPRAAHNRVRRQWVYALLTPLYLSHFLAVTALAEYRVAFGLRPLEYQKAEHGTSTSAKPPRLLSFGELWSGSGLMFVGAALLALPPLLFQKWTI